MIQILNTGISKSLQVQVQVSKAYMYACICTCKGRYTRGGLLLKHGPETRSRVSTPTSTHEGHNKGAEW